MSSPEILIVDEALSVGDVFFQQKCIRRMQDFAKTGTIIFVSHDLNTMAKLCDRVIWLESGNVIMDGEPNQVISKYTSNLLKSKGEEFKLSSNQDLENKSKLNLIEGQMFKSKEQIGPIDGEILKAEIINEKNQSNFFNGNEKATLKIDVMTLKDFDEITLGFSVKNRLGLEVFGTNTFDENCKLDSSEKIRKTIEFSFTMPQLQSGIYTISLGFAEGNPMMFNQLHYIHDAIDFQVAKPNDRGVLFYHKMDETKSY
jgi:ABC-type Fe3+/spermidine/putrescine transport system ATPase subunit